jgi:hypothetical protein
VSLADVDVHVVSRGSRCDIAAVVSRDARDRCYAKVIDAQQAKPTEGTA